MKHFSLFIFLAFILTQWTSAESLQLVWKLEGLSAPESVIYDARNGVLYVSNINGAPDARDGNGYISKVSVDGKMIEENWLGGLDAPKGLAVFNDRLYVTDIDTLVEIDLTSASILNKYVDNEAKFLNDVTVAEDGSVYVSDMVTNRIHLLKDGAFSVWLTDTDLDNPNGLHAERLQLVIGAWGKMTDGFTTAIPGHMKAVNYHDRAIRSLGDGQPVGNLDGVEPVDDAFYVTDWFNGGLFHIDRYGNVKKLLELEKGSADLEYLPWKKQIFIPMMLNNTLVAYQVK